MRRALDAGVCGYLLKDAPAEDLAEALRKVHRGGRAIDPNLALEAWGEADPLNDRERQTLRLAGEGMSAGEIAAKLNLSQGTVRNYLSEAIGTRVGNSTRRIGWRGRRAVVAHARWRPSPANMLVRVRGVRGAQVRVSPSPRPSTSPMSSAGGHGDASESVSLMGGRCLRGPCSGIAFRGAGSVMRRTTSVTGVQRLIAQRDGR